jgi:hypothetical protein
MGERDRRGRGTEGGEGRREGEGRRGRGTEVGRGAEGGRGTEGVHAKKIYIIVEYKSHDNIGNIFQGNRITCISIYTTLYCVNKMKNQTQMLHLL